MSAQYTTNELLAAAVAREIADGDLVFIGVGTTDRAFTLACGVGVVATGLAQSAHAPDASIYWGNLLSPDLSRMPQSWLQDTFTRWPAASQLTETAQKNDMLAFGRFDVSFESAAQVDRYGNLNITRLNHPDGSIKTRLIGCLAQTEHLAFVRKPIIMVDLKQRTFVEEVDYVTSLGHQRHGVPRQSYGLSGPGPQLCITDKAIFDFKGEGGGMRIRSLHPGVKLDEVLELMGFAPEIPATLAETTPPTAAEVKLIRTKIDPNRTLLRV
ncbi:CoA-transferase [Shumkonia mesophila]|uniref:CoA-transferase n=1 Tax=Shumkonia mesophila TaxID=2838854 RepID=UPI002934DA00|nr:CoA-transferase [Shumkonia mesophila]